MRILIIAFNSRSRKHIYINVLMPIYRQLATSRVYIVPSLPNLIYILNSLIGEYTNKVLILNYKLLASMRNRELEE